MNFDNINNIMNKKMQLRTKEENEILHQFLLQYVINEDDLSRKRATTIISSIKKVGVDYLDKYHYRLTYFWNLMKISDEELNTIAPIVFIEDSRNKNMMPTLPDNILKKLNVEQIYAICRNTSVIKLMSIQVAIYWKEKFQNIDYDYSYFKERKLKPFYLTKDTRSLKFNEILDIIYHIKLKENTLLTTMKPVQFYEQTDLISLTNAYNYLIRFHTTYVGFFIYRDVMRKLFNIKGIKDIVVNEPLELLSYSGLILLLNEQYSYGTIENMEDLYDMRYLQKKYIETHQEDINYTQYIYNRYLSKIHYQELPSLKLINKNETKAKILYQYKDVIKYIQDKEIERKKINIAENP